jgi:hypothetical protein
MGAVISARRQGSSQRIQDSSNDGFKITINGVKIMLDICILLFDNFKTGE